MKISRTIFKLVLMWQLRGVYSAKSDRSIVSERASILCLAGLFEC